MGLWEIAGCSPPPPVARAHTLRRLPLSCGLQCLASMSRVVDLLSSPFFDVAAIAGIGKSAVVEVAAKLLGRQFTRISCSSGLTVDDLFGTYRPTLDTMSGKVVFLFEEGPLARAVEQNWFVLLYGY